MKRMFEIFEEYEKLDTHEQRIECLRKNDNYALRSVLQGAFDPKIEFTVESVPYYKPVQVPVGLSYSTIMQELKRVYLFVKGHPNVSPNLTENRKTQILIQILETLEPKEATVFMNMLLKNLKVKNLDESVVKEAFPDLIP